MRKRLKKPGGENVRNWKRWMLSLLLICLITPTMFAGQLVVLAEETPEIVPESPVGAGSFHLIEGELKLCFTEPEFVQLSQQIDQMIYQKAMETAAEAARPLLAAVEEKNVTITLQNERIDSLAGEKLLIGVLVGAGGLIVGTLAGVLIGSLIK